METILKPAIRIATLELGGYEFLLGVSSDCLIILNKNKELIEWICVGDNNDGIVLEADTEDDFLDAIILIRRMINEGANPLMFLWKML